MQDTKTTPYHKCFKVQNGVSHQYFINANLPVEINGKFQDRFTIRLHITAGKKLRLCTHISFAEGTSQHPSKGEEDNKPFIYLYASLLKKLLDGEDFEEEYPSTEFSTKLKIFFSKHNKGYYLEQIPVKHLEEPLTTVRQRVLSGEEVKDCRIFFFSEDTHSKLVDIFKSEKELRNQLGW